MSSLRKPLSPMLKTQQTAHATHVADWKQANQIPCALDSATTSCNFDACPAVTKPTVATGVENADSQHCTPEPTTAPTQAPSWAPTQAPTQAPTKAPTGAPTPPWCNCRCVNGHGGRCFNRGDTLRWVGNGVNCPARSSYGGGGCSGTCGCY